MPYPANFPQRPPDAVHALLAANRLEARPRSAEFNRALRAEVRDATWLLARQWQMHEFRAEDRGTPASVTLVSSELPLSQLALGSQAARPYDARHQPLEAAVEAQPRVIGLGLRLQMGQYWLRQLRTALRRAASPLSPPATTQLLAGFAQVFGVLPQVAAQAPVAYALEASQAEAQALLELAGPLALDGYRLYQALLAPFAAQLGPALADSDLLLAQLQQPSGTPLLPLAQRLLAAYPAAQPLQDALPLAQLELEAARYVATFHRLYLLGEDSAGWSTEGMAYRFAAGTAEGQGLGTTHYPGGGALPWYAVDAQPAPAGGPAEARTRRLLPTEVQFPGAPAARWWEFEDRRVDFGQLTGTTADWGRMLLQEFMFLYQNDWFTVPYLLEGGRVCRFDKVVITDVFERQYTLQPAGAGQLREAPADGGALIDNDAGRWRLFAQTDPANAAAAPQLYLPPTALAPLVSPPVEQVSFRREEATNLVWAVESTVPDGFAGGLDGAGAAARVADTLRTLAAPPAPAGAEAGPTPAYAYQLASAVPENWIPFVPLADEGPLAPGLAQGVLQRQGLLLAGPDLLVQPRTGLLQLHPGQPYPLHEHEVPAAGMRVEGRSYRARWHDGRTISWFGRQRGPAQPGGSSGLAFDQLRPAV